MYVVSCTENLEKNGFEIYKKKDREIYENVKSKIFRCISRH